MSFQPGSAQSDPRLRRGVRLLGAMALAVGALMMLIALSVYLTQGSQIRVTARVLSEHCHPQTDLATGAGETRCDAAVRYRTLTGRVINTTVTDAFPYEIRHTPGRPATMLLRYDSSYPADPFKQSNYMPAGTFLMLLGISVAATSFGVLSIVRAGRYAENIARRRLRTPLP